MKKAKKGKMRFSYQLTAKKGKKSRDQWPMSAIVDVLPDNTPKSRAELLAYWEAHELLPRFYKTNALGVWSTQHVLRSIAVLSQESPKDSELLRALAVLGHSPCLQALEALGQYGSSRKKLAPIARHAEAECLALMDNQLPFAEAS